MNVITGLPRSGSTLLCNILNQNPEIKASSTSGLCEILNTISIKLTNMPEVTSDLISEVDSEDKIINAMRSFSIEYTKTDKPVYFNKSRGWASSMIMLRTLFPESFALVCVRNPLDVFASIEKQHRRTGIFDGAVNSAEKLIIDRADKMFSPEGIVGQAIMGVEDVLRRKHQNIILVRYEELVDSPDMVLNNIYKKMKLDDNFKHDFDNVINTSSDVDALYRGKFPHKGDGSVKPQNGSWQDYFSDDLAKMIMDRFPFYFSKLGYN